MHHENMMNALTRPPGHSGRALTFPAALASLMS